MKDPNSFVKFILGCTPDYTFCSPDAPCYNIEAHSIVVECILQSILKGD
jgi:hypothetical protein